MSRVTVAIPTYNRLRFLRPCLESIKRQSFKDIEVIIFDDHSTEPIQEEAESILGRKVSFFPSSTSLGAARNIERALRHTYASEYLMIFHDDDVMHPELIQREVQLLDTHQEAAFAASTISFVSNANAMNSFFSVRNESGSFTVYKTPAELVRAFIKGVHLGFSSVLYRANVLSPKATFETERFGANGDRPLLLGLMKERSAILITEPLVNYRVHPAQDSMTYRNTKPDQIQRNLFDFYRSLLPRPLTTQDKKLFLTFTTNALLDSWARRGASMTEALKAAKLAGKELYNPFFIRFAGIRALIKMAL